MKLQIKLNREQSEAFTNFSNTLKPEDATDEQWLQMIFFTGCETINTKVYEMAQEYAEQQAEELEASGINIIEGDDGITMKPTEVPDASVSASAL